MKDAGEPTGHGRFGRLDWCFPDEDAALAEHVADRFKRGDTAFVPSFWPHEVVYALLAGGEARADFSGTGAQFPA